MTDTGIAKPSHRFIVSADLSRKTADITNERIVHKIRNVLRLSAGDGITLCDGAGNEAEATITAVTDESIEIMIGEPQPVSREPELHVAIWCAVLKKDRFEWMAEKVTEIGAQRIVPVVTGRTVKQNIDHRRLRQKTVEAAEQSGRGVVPAVAEPLEYEEAVTTDRTGSDIVLDHSGEQHIGDVPVNGHCNIWIGPEGGWTEHELETFRDRTAVIAHAGTMNLRAETAAIAGTYVVINN